MRSLIVLSLLISTSWGYGIPPISTRATAGQTRRALKLTPAEEDNIREAVFRYLFFHNASSLQLRANVYLLKNDDGRELTDAFIARFKGHTPPVKKLSTDKFELIDKETGNRGLIFSASTIKPLTRNKVIVQGGYYEGPLSGSGNTYTVERLRGRWVVTKDLMRWIS